MEAKDYEIGDVIEYISYGSSSHGKVRTGVIENIDKTHMSVQFYIDEHWGKVANKNEVRLIHREGVEPKPRWTNGSIWDNPTGEMLGPRSEVLRRKPNPL